MRMIKNKEKNVILISFLVFLLSSFVSPVLSQEKETSSVPSSKLRVFLDCKTCDLKILKEEIRFADFIIEPAGAQVEVFITSQDVDEGGSEYSIVFKGRGEFEGDNDQLTWCPDPISQPEETSKKLAAAVKMGLMRYAGKMPLASRISIAFQDKVKPTAVLDKWDFWVFSLSANTFLNGEKIYKSGSYYGSISANRTTPDLKIRLSLRGSFNKNTFTFEDTVIKSTSNSKNFSGMIVKSLNDHWSVGAYFSLTSSTYANTKLSFLPAPAIEFDLFPYSESTKRQLRFLYRMGLNLIRYEEETIYEKMKENLWGESLSIILEAKQKWGTMGASLIGSHYFHDFSKNRVQLRGNLSLRLIRGLNLNMNANYSRIRDQLSLMRGEASLEEILLRRKEIGTTYRYSVSVGLSFTFGSTRSKVVNPRFGTGGGGFSISF